MSTYSSSPTGPSTSGPMAQKVLSDMLGEILADMHNKGAPSFVVSLAHDAGQEFIDARRRSLPSSGESMTDVLRALSARIFAEVDGGDAMDPWVLAAKTASLRFITQRSRPDGLTPETDWEIRRKLDASKPQASLIETLADGCQSSSIEVPR